MIDWLYTLPIFWMAVVVFAATYLVAAILAVSILLIAAHNRPFTGELSVQPDILLQVLPAQGTTP